MDAKIKYAYIATLIFSILIYAIPYDYGGNVLRAVMAVLAILSFIYVGLSIWRAINRRDRNVVALLIVNALAVLHFILIFLSVVMNASYLVIFLVGILTAGICFYFIHHRMKDY